MQAQMQPQIQPEIQPGIQPGIELDSCAQLAEPNAQASNTGAISTLAKEPVLTASSPYKKPKGPYSFYRSTAIISLLLFCAIDLIVAVTFHPDLYALPQHSYIFWAVKGFRALKRTPDILIFGSSLMVAVTDQGDATYLKHPVDAALHHRSVCLEDALARKTGVPVSTYSFAIGGQMASDVYAIERTLIGEQQPPKVIVWGIAPRDFLDAAFDGPYSSDTARYMNRIAQAPIIPEDHHSLPGYIEKALSKVSAIFRWRTDLAQIGGNVWRKWLSGNDTAASNKTGSPDLQPSLHQLSLEIGDCIVPACTELPTNIRDNSAEYQKRYNPFKPKTLKSQLEYLDKFLTLNERLGVKVVLINMPLTQRNMAIMPNGAYTQYLDGVTKLARLHGSQLINWNDAGSFTTKDFSDFVHLTGLGGEKFVALLGTKLTM
jgi:hypothetical protein